MDNMSNPRKEILQSKNNREALKAIKRINNGSKCNEKDITAFALETDTKFIIKNTGGRKLGI